MNLTTDRGKTQISTEDRVKTANFGRESREKSQISSNNPLKKREFRERIAYEVEILTEYRRKNTIFVIGRCKKREYCEKIFKECEFRFIIAEKRKFCQRVARKTMNFVKRSRENVNFVKRLLEKHEFHEEIAGKM